MSILLNFMFNSKNTTYYRFLGETNSPVWVNNLENILSYDSKNIDYRQLNDITNLLNNILKERYPGQDKLSMYPKLTRAKNSRFSYCWFLHIENDASTLFKIENWDICIQMFDDEWYLVNVGDGSGRFNYWYVCDQYEGLKNFIEEKILKNESNKIDIK